MGETVMIELELNEQTRSKRKWSWTKRNLARANDILSAMDELRKWWPMTARQIYYRLISSDAVNQDHWHWKGKQVDIYKALGLTLKWMRIDEKLSWSAITDDHRVTTPKIGFADVREFIDCELDSFLYGYARCMAQKQENYIEVWVEKATLLHIIKPVADEFCRRVVVCRGFNSITFQTMFYNRASEAINMGQQPIVLYFGDWDPSGVNMIHAGMQTLTDELDLYGVKYSRAGINPEHFGMIEADPVPIKHGDSRSRRFIEQHGTTAYELDAFHPEQLQKLVRESIESFTDMSGYDENNIMESDDIDTIMDLRSDVEEYINDKVDELGI
jgi:hypothetical protein